MPDGTNSEPRETFDAQRSTFPRLRRFGPWIAAIVSGVLLALSFPPAEVSDCAWFGIVPLLIVLRDVNSKKGFQLGFTAGAVWWLCSIFWLTHVTYVGWFLLSLYSGLFTGFFGWLVAKWFSRFGSSSLPSNIGLMIVAPLVWVTGEFVRCTLGTGFPWNPLGVSQYKNIVLIQLASLGGAYLVSALVVWMNTALAAALLGYFARAGAVYRRLFPELLLGLLVIGSSYAAGFRLLREVPESEKTVRVALIQPNIPQDEKWDQEKIDFIYARLRELTETVSHLGKLDLIVWPETALPDDLRYSEPSYNLVRALATNGIPILVGSMDTIFPDNDENIYLNSSMLIDTSGRLEQQYDKRHLVPFGEYVPLRHLLPFMKAMTPIQASFSPGTTSTVFRLNGTYARFSVLICFEDAVAQLARESVRNGARLLINQTNDAWFDPSASSRQHMIQCVFRCVENHVPALRSANTGVSCHIDSRGRIQPTPADAVSTVRTGGFYTHVVKLAPDDLPLTFYTRHGDVFAVSALIASLVLAGWFALPRFSRSR
jgi:apolipoprotein N-acyltransferase